MFFNCISQEYDSQYNFMQKVLIQNYFISMKKLYMVQVTDKKF
jgi:hypothetical protein